MLTWTCTDTGSFMAGVRGKTRKKIFPLPEHMVSCTFILFSLKGGICSFFLLSVFAKTFMKSMTIGRGTVNRPAPIAPTHFGPKNHTLTIKSA